MIGEKGSGKTTLLKQLLSSTKEEWRYCKLLFHSKKNSNKVKELGKLHDRVGILFKAGLPPVLIIDDAHEINVKGLRYLLEHTLISRGSRKFRGIILFCEPTIEAVFHQLSECIPNDAVVNKLYIKPMTDLQTAHYLHMLSKYLDPLMKKRFSAMQIKKIYNASQGLPGRINEEAYRIYKDNAFWKRSEFLKKIMPRFMNS